MENWKEEREDRGTFDAIMEDNFPPAPLPDDEETPPEVSGHMEPPPVIDFAAGEQAASSIDPIIDQYAKEHPESVSDDYRQEKINAVLNSSNMAVYLATQYENERERYAAREDVPTGFENIDGYTGGMEPGLYVIGAGTGLGKTTFCLQMADYMAAFGYDVIYIALEQTPFELVSKSIARLAAQISGKKLGKDTETITSKKIRKKRITDEMRPIYEQAKQRYMKEIAPKMNIMHFRFQTSTTDIIRSIEEFREQKKQKEGRECWPVIFIDYLQVLEAPEDTPKNADRRRQVDAIMFELKTYSEEMPIFVVSSINRSNYTARIDYEAFKESGNIEYTGETIFGLQLKCITDDDKTFGGTTETNAGAKRKKIMEEMEKEPREVELICLKNRYGGRFGNRRRACFKYYPACDLFEVDYDYFVPHMKKYFEGGKTK